MKFSAQEEYGLRCLMALACEGEGGFLTIPEISKREGLSTSHVAKLLGLLRKAGHVKSTRGQAGGYMLGGDPKGILITDVLAALGGRLFSDGFCDRHSGVLPECVHDTECLLRPLWSRVQTAVDHALEGLTVADLIDWPYEQPTIVVHSRPRRFRSLAGL